MQQQSTNRLAYERPRSGSLTRTIAMSQEPDDGSEKTSTRSHAAGDPVLLAAGAVLLMGAAVLPGLSRLIVLPALLLAPGYALLRLLGQAAGQRPISVAMPVSLVLIIIASLALYGSGIGLGPTSLGLVLGSVTALSLAVSYGRELAARRVGQLQRPLPSDRDLGRHHAGVADRRFVR